MRQFLGIDVGGSAIKYSLLTEEGEILEKGDIPTPTQNADDFVEAIGSIYDKYAGKVEAMAMSAPGRIDSSRGYFYTGGALSAFAVEFDMKAALEKRIPIPFSIENDGKCAGLAELWVGSLKGYNSGSIIVLGSGIGGAIILDGKLVRGETFAAGEYSGISTRWDIPQRGFANVWGMTNSTNGLVATYAARIGKNPSELNGRIFFDAVNDGDEIANDVLRTFCGQLVTGIYSLQIILDVQRFCIGGGISKQPKLMEYIQEELDACFASMPSFCPAHKPEVVTCTSGNDANMIGALYHYLFECKKD